MDRKARRELIVKSALEVLENVMPTNIMQSLDRLEDEEEFNENQNDLDEDRFFFEKISQNREEASNIIPKIELDNDSLTYFEIVEQEMMQSLPVCKETIGVSS